MELLDKSIKPSDGWHRPVIFVAATFLLSWSLWIAASRIAPSSLDIDLLLFTVRISARDLFILLGNAAPGVVALTMAFEQRCSSRLLGRLLPAKPRFFVYLFAILAPIAVNLLMLLVTTDFNSTIFSQLSPEFVPRYIATNIFLAPLWEELGWRGYLVPLVERRIGLGRTCLLTSCAWGVWHFALYYWVGGVRILTFTATMTGIIGGGVVLTVLFCASNQNLVLPIVFHTCWNAAANWVISERSPYGTLPALVQSAGAWGLALVSWRVLIASGRHTKTAKPRVEYMGG